MTRGRIVLITENGVLTSTEFNGDMYYDWYGKTVIEELGKVKTEQEYREFVEKFNKENFGYEEELIYDACEIAIYDNGNVKTEIIEEAELFNFAKDYFGKWGSDYLYIKNIRDSEVEMMDDEGVGLVVEAGSLLMLHYGTYEEECKEHSISVRFTLSEMLKEVCENLDWNVIDEGDFVELEKYSPAGEDFSFTVSIVNFVKEVEDYADDFDPDEHAEMWVGCRGTRGVPSSIRTLIEDADDIQKMLDELVEALKMAIKGKTE